jgi:hypothetical protein
VVVTGTSGIGKSFFGIYALLRAVREKDITVVYTMCGQSDSLEQYIVAPPASKMATFLKGDPRRLLLDLREDFPGMLGEDVVDEEEDQDTKNGVSLWWGEVKQHADSKTFLKRLKGGTSTWVFVDVQKGVVTEGTRRVVVLVSDDPAAYSSFVKHMSGVVLYMPVWTEKELVDAAKTTCSPLDQAEVQRRYAMVGGVPRSAFSEQWKQTVKEVDHAIAGLRPDTLGTTLVPGSNPIVTSRLVHQVSKAPFHDTQTVYASEYVRTAIYKRFICEEQFKLQMWLKYTKGLVGGSERGPQFEWFAHVVLGKLDAALKAELTPLKKDSQGTPSSISLRPFADKTGTFDKVEDLAKVEGLASLAIGQYMQPLSSSYPSIDAFCVSKGVPWVMEGPANEAPTLLLFQMTVAHKHPTLGNALEKVIDCVHKLGASARNAGMNFNKKKHEVYLVFIVEEAFAKAEPYMAVGNKTPLKNPGNELKEIKQVCIRIH